MTQENINLMIADAAARIPYGTKCMDLDTPEKVYNFSGLYKDNVSLTTDTGGFLAMAITGIKLYLRSFNAMTEKEGKEHFMLMGEGNMNKIIDFYLQHHIDYRGLIPKGLAIEAPTGMYIL